MCKVACNAPVAGSTTANILDVAALDVPVASSVANDRAWDLAEWLDQMTASAKVATVLGSILRHSGIWGAADEAVLNEV